MNVKSVGWLKTLLTLTLMDDTLVLNDITNVQISK